jgi:hypothetical protein
MLEWGRQLQHQPMCKYHSPIEQCWPTDERIEKKQIDCLKTWINDSKKCLLFAFEFGIDVGVVNILQNTKICFQTFELIAIVVKPKISTLPKTIDSKTLKEIGLSAFPWKSPHDNPHYIGLAISDNLKYNTPEVHWQLKLCILFTYIPFPNPNGFLQSDPRSKPYTLVGH